ncbi:helix-turn-helix domain-containing protein, partial [Enterococcus sp. S181_ASV_20]|nr:helix-turn-helix domain-containing protein [Enterococcus sp. S181_ASV_20]
MAQRNLDYRLLKDRRNEYGVSQNKLATACGLSPVSYTHLPLPTK